MISDLRFTSACRSAVKLLFNRPGGAFRPSMALCRSIWTHPWHWIAELPAVHVWKDHERPLPWCFSLKVFLILDMQRNTLSFTP